jgi:hypothetical protein
MMKTKQLITTDLEINKAKREILCVASTDDVDRDLEVVLPFGLRKANYAGRPVLWSHNHDTPSLGTILWLKPDSSKRKILCKHRFSDKTEFARDVFDLLTDDPPALNSYSIGFEVFAESGFSPDEIRARPEWANARNCIRDFEVLEISVANIPCNQNAIVIAKKFSPETQRLLGDDWQDVDMWEYTKAVAEPVATLPVPKFARKWNAQETIAKVLRQHDANELLAKIQGKA